MSLEYKLKQQTKQIKDTISQLLKRKMHGQSKKEATKITRSSPIQTKDPNAS
jgi:hypothetical protein